MLRSKGQSYWLCLKWGGKPYMLRNLSVCQKEALPLNPIVSGKWDIWFSIGYYHTNLQVPLDPINMYLWCIAKHSGSSGPGNSHPGLLNLLTSPTSSFLFIPTTPLFSAPDTQPSLVVVSHYPLSIRGSHGYFGLSQMPVAILSLPLERHPLQFHIYTKTSFTYGVVGLVWWFHCTLTYSGYVSGTLYRIIHWWGICWVFYATESLYCRATWHVS